MKKIFTLFICITTYSFLFGQSTYQVDLGTETYQPLSNSISLNQGAVWDDPEFIVPLGFDFTIGTQTFNTLYFSDLGFGGELSNQSPATGVGVWLSPVGQDISDLGFMDEISKSPISYVIDGTVGNRIVKIEWSNVGFLEDTTEEDFMNFQVWLYEAGNVIEYRYGAKQINNAQEVFIDDDGIAIGFYPSLELEDWDYIGQDCYILTGTTTNPVMQTVTPQQFENEGTDNFTGMIAENTVITFTPSTLSTKINSKFEEIIIYPNPVVTDIIYISGTNDIKSVEIYDLLGKKLRNATVNNNSINVNNLQKGAYLLKLETANGKVTKKFIK